MIVRRRPQRKLGEEALHQLIADHEDMKWEAWMKEADKLLDDEELIEIVYEALAGRHPESARLGRESTPCEVVLRMMLLKHIRNWSYEEMEREVRANLIYREFTRIGTGRVPEHTTMVKLGQAIGDEHLKKLNRVLATKARDKKIAPGRKMRLDTTVTESNIHYPTDSSLLADGVRVLNRMVGKIREVMEETGENFRDRSRTVKRRLIEIGKSAAQRSEQAKQKRNVAYKKLMGAARATVNQAVKVAEEAGGKVNEIRDAAKRAMVKRAIEQILVASAFTNNVIKQTRERVVKGNTHYKEKVVSLFEPETEIIKKGKSGKPAEFGKMVKIQEAENQIITDYDLYDHRPQDSDLLMSAIEAHVAIYGRPPKLVAADGGFRGHNQEATAVGVKHVAIPQPRGRSPNRKPHPRWFKLAQRWRAGCEGRISVLKRRHGLFKSKYKGTSGMRRWVGLGVIASNLISMGRVLANR